MPPRQILRRPKDESKTSQSHPAQTATQTQRHEAKTEERHRQPASGGRADGSAQVTRPRREVQGGSRPPTASNAVHVATPLVHAQVAPPPPPTGSRRWEVAPTPTATTSSAPVVAVPAEARPEVVEKKQARSKAHKTPRQPSAGLSIADFVKPAKKKAPASVNQRASTTPRIPPPPTKSPVLGSMSVPKNSISSVETDPTPPPTTSDKPQKKKKLSTLKKRVVKDRAAKWVSFHAAMATQEASEVLSSPSVAEASRRIQVIHLVEPDEVEDDNEYDDTLADVTTQFQSHGSIVSIHLDRATGTIDVEYAIGGSASAAVAALHNAKFGGHQIACVRIPDDATSQVALRQVHVDGFCSPDELVDPDEFDEVVTDVQRTFSTPQHVLVHADVDKSTGSIRLEYASTKAAIEIAALFHRKAFGGKTIRAVWHKKDDDDDDDLDDAKEKQVAECAIPPVRKLPNAQAIREYVDQAIDVGGEFENLVTAFLGRLMSLQERARLTNPLKAKKTRRLVFGLREVKRGLKNGKIMCLMVAYNIDECAAEGGLDDKVIELIDLARVLKITVIFSLSKRKLGKALLKSIRVSCVGIYNVDGANDMWGDVKKKAASLQGTTPSIAPEEAGSVPQDLLNH
ncbi:Aste57867_22520 [Aphanomyces stellatus]|uniref:Aste57867_22520 protein n=1 Tax=Aphanomyces stellatus TaxID=120398 RepID=A0A485LL00_9STRA|nr:hypothetical protein As57867_022450 [Aphanomyces stellatus]VFT99180.1 Aste57867_22520 [Aphanomyces stellatus]